MNHQSGIPLSTVRALVIVLIWVFCGLLPAVRSGMAQNPNWGAVAGRVVDAKSQTPVVGAHVVVEETGYGAASDARGYYTLRLPAGRHVLCFTAIGYAPISTRSQSTKGGRRLWTLP